MRKSVTLISSLALCLALAVPAIAAPQGNPAKKAHAGPMLSVQPKEAADVLPLNNSLMLRRKSASSARSMFKTDRGPVVISNTPISTSAKQRVPYAAAQSSAPALMGCIVYADSWLATGAAYGVYSFDMNGNAEMVASDVNAQFGACVVGDKYWAAYQEDYWGIFVTNYTYLYNMEDWSVINYITQTDYSCFASALAAHPTTNVVYGSFYNADASAVEIGTLNAETYTRTGTLKTITDIADQWSAASFAPDGTLYVVTNGGDFGTVNLETGDFTLLKATGFTPQYLTSGAYDSKSGKFYYILCTDTEDTLYAIDVKNDYAITKCYDVPDNAEVMGLYVPAPLAEDGAPAAVTDLSVVFNGGALTGTAEFTLPSTTYAEDALSGPLSYKLYANNDVIASGTGNAGQTVSCPVAVSESGECTFIVVTTNSVGDSPKSNKVALYVGNDQPAKVSGLNMAFDKDALSVALTWDAVTSSVHGGYFDPAAVSYTVTRYKNDEVDTTFDRLTDTTFDDLLPSPDGLVAYSYGIQAVFGDAVSAEAVSNYAVAGSALPPYLNDFSTPLDAAFMTIYSPAGEKEWSYNAESKTMSVIYDTKKDKNAWLFTPALNLEAGKAYEFSFATWAGSLRYGNERVEVYMGTSPTVEAMAVMVADATEVDVDKANPMIVSGMLVPSADGEYYVGIHAISDADHHFLYADDISVSAPFASGASDIVTDFKAVPARDGNPDVTISFKAPTTTVLGKRLTSINTIEVSRDGEVVKVFDNPTFGSELSFVDNAGTCDDHKYSIVAYNDAGAGRVFSKTVFCGIGELALPVNVQISEDPGNPGTVILSWEPVLEDVNGNPVSPDVVGYRILADDGQTWLSGNYYYPASAPEFKYVACEPGQQVLTMALVVPYTVSTGVTSSSYAASDMIAVGTPYSCPFVESFPSSQITYNWMVSSAGCPDGRTGDNNWAIGKGSSTPECDPVDGDGGMLVWNPKTGRGNAYSNFISGLISVPDNDKAAFSFYYFNEEGSTSYDFRPFVMIGNSGEKHYLCDKLTNGEGAEAGWNRVLLSLGQYKGQIIKVGLEANCYNYNTLLCIDNFIVKAFADYDLAVQDFQIPANVKVGKESTVSAVVINYGNKDAGAYTVDLLIDGKVVETNGYDGLEASASQKVEFKVTAEIFSPETLSYQVKVNFAQDMVLDNNATEVKSAPVIQSTLPAVKDLEGSADGLNVNLAWSTPDLDNYAGAGDVESFEEYESFIIDNIGDWTLYDVDQAEHTYGFQGISFDNMNYKGSFIVFDAEGMEGANEDSKQKLMGHTGSKSICCFAADDRANDDWLVSPELPGMAQTVTFWAKSFDAQYLETFEFLYSTTDNNRDSFKSVAIERDIADDWNEYSFQLPEGTKYFAIRCISNDCFIFMVDDISFALESTEIHLKGYDVYRDGVKVNDALVTECGYTDANVEEGSHNYNVVVVYDEGESTLSNTVVVEASGIESIASASVGIAADKGAVVVTGTEGLNVSIVNAAGLTLHNAVATGSTVRVSVLPGVYVVKAGTKVAKLVVK